MTFRQALAQIAAALDLPFGYTLATWSAATLAVYYRGAPSPRPLPCEEREAGQAEAGRRAERRV